MVYLLVTGVETKQKYPKRKSEIADRMIMPTIVWGTVLFGYMFEVLHIAAIMIATLCIILRIGHSILLYHTRATRLRAVQERLRSLP
jgi:hypothetical protein